MTTSLRGWAIRIATVTALAGVLAASGVAQVWIHQYSADHPPKRYQHAMAYDEARERVVLFGGLVWGVGWCYGDTWEWDGARWHERRPQASPAPRAMHAMAYDSVRQRVVLFGGGDRRTGFTDTWEWDGSNWTRRQPSTSPPYGGSMAYDRSRQETLLFFFGETWVWNGTNWARRSPSRTPTRGGPLTYDSARARIVLVTAVTNNIVETWEWDGNDWTMRNPVTSPTPRVPHAIAYHAAWERIVLFGGSDATTGGLADTWEWDGIDWRQVATPWDPPGGRDTRLAYDAARRRVVMFGGDAVGLGELDETWEYNPAPAAYTRIGQGCVGSHGKAPVLGHLSQPTVGGRFVLDLWDAPPTVPGALVYGLANANTSLGPLGAPGCTAFALPGASVSVSTTPGGSWSRAPVLAIPDVLALVGNPLFVQAYFVDSGANALGVVASNGGEAVLGF